jgi:hypothetical protein
MGRMCAPSADDINARLRAFFRHRNHRPLTEPEAREYEQMLSDWTAADRRERISRTDVIEVA